jgi:hypothetical protein
MRCAASIAFPTRQCTLERLSRNQGRYSITMSAATTNKPSANAARGGPTHRATFSSDRFSPPAKHGRRPDCALEDQRIARRNAVMDPFPSIQGQKILCGCEPPASSSTGQSLTEFFTS